MRLVSASPYRSLFPFLVFVLVATAAGCGLARPYRCTSELEQEAYNQSSRNIFPDDVRSTLGAYVGKTMVAWVGIVLESYYNVGEKDVEADIIFEHHHFDWLEDFKLGENHYILSPRGEGRFRAVWPMRMDFGLDEVKRWTAPGNMAVVYGRPIEVDKGIIELEAFCIRFILKNRCHFSEYPYGRYSGWQY